MRNREAYLQRRKELKELSKLAKARIETDCEGMTVNEVLVNEFYTSKVHQEFNTLFEWNNKGYKVKKGSQSFCVWGSPKLRNSDKEAEKIPPKKMTQNFTRFAICLVMPKLKKDDKK